MHCFLCLEHNLELTSLVFKEYLLNTYSVGVTVRVLAHSSEQNRQNKQTNLFSPHLQLLEVKLVVQENCSDLSSSGHLEPLQCHLGGPVLPTVAAALYRTSWMELWGRLLLQGMDHPPGILTQLGAPPRSLPAQGINSFHGIIWKIE